MPLGAALLELRECAARLKLPEVCSDLGSLWCCYESLRDI